MQGSQVAATDTAAAIAQAQKDLYNTKLFSKVGHRAQAVGNQLIVKFILKERWFTHGVPYMGIIDRNFNEWWVVQGHDPDRVMLGADVVQNNLTGRNDRLMLSLLVGYQERCELEYRLPQHLLKGKVGLHTALLYHRYQSVNYGTAGNQLQYVLADSPQLRRLGFETEATYHWDFNKWWWLALSWQQETIGREVISLAPNYIHYGIDTWNHARLRMGLRLDLRDVRGYAQRGSLLVAEISAFVLPQYVGHDYMQAYLRWVRHVPLSPRVNLVLATGTKLSNNRMRPYMLNRGLGWELNLLRNYDYYVVDGHFYFFQKASLRYLCIDKAIRLEKSPLGQFKYIPFKLAPNLYADLGYVANAADGPVESFANRPLYSAGIGLEMVFFDDSVWRLEYGANHTGETGVYINFTAAIQ
jgi:outer membrane protein assembly factor BamA